MNRKAIAWATFDWANSAFPTVVSTFVIAAYFSQGIAPDPATGQAQWGWMQTVAAVCIALLSPVLGALADNGGRRMMLAACTLVTAACTALVWFALPDPSWTLYVLVCVGLATIAFEIGTVFYNAMLPEVTTPEHLGRVSGLAWGLGYAGGLVCLGVALVLLIQPNPALFGLDRAESEHVRATALLVGAWTLVFAWPVLMFVPDRPGARLPPGQAVAACLADTKRLIQGLPQRPDMLRFLVARLFYTDGLNTLFAFGAIYAAGVHGMGMEDILLFGIALNVTAGLGAAGFGLIDDRIGAKRVVMIALVCMVVLGAALLLTASVTWFWALAMALGIFMGPAQAASRTLMAQMAPDGQCASHFGLFALSGRITGFLGPAVLAAVTAATGSQALGMSTVLVFLALGAVILATVRPVRG
ncbi:MFS transporter [Roseomonas fluvialis]|uniref:MFS transporter n=1 Tax=Roseomonas fluvialis TaxID=1750527 RepID=A0ABM7YA73_9PROT|nr:MFS transporter [Roseomonas fluvialis]BDG74949.1 MFS transporter [Roseomonas fluvialis]